MLAGGRANAAPDEVAVNRCRGVRHGGYPCRWTSASDDPVAATLREGGHFCFWHTTRRKPKPIDPRQQSLERFLVGAAPSKGGNAGAGADAARAAAASSKSGGAAGDVDAASEGTRACASPARSRTVPLTPEQLERIAINRSLALERKLRRQSSDASLPSSPASEPLLVATPLASQASQVASPLPLLTAPPPVVLSQAQVERIAQRRRDALERKRRLEEAASATTATACAVGDKDRGQPGDETSVGKTTAGEVATSKTSYCKPAAGLTTDGNVAAGKVAGDAIAPGETAAMKSVGGESSVGEVFLCGLVHGGAAASTATGETAVGEATAGEAGSCEDLADRALSPRTRSRTPQISSSTASCTPTRKAAMDWLPPAPRARSPPRRSPAPSSPARSGRARSRTPPQQRQQAQAMLASTPPARLSRVLMARLTGSPLPPLRNFAAAAAAARAANIASHKRAGGGAPACSSPGPYG